MKSAKEMFEELGFNCRDYREIKFRGKFKV